MKNKMKRLIRGLQFLLTSLLIEKPRGIDFSLRQKTRDIKTEGNHGYALTQEKAFSKIMEYINPTSDDCFIDIGCGKGGVLRYAAKYGFKRVAGVEIEDSLYAIAKANFQKLKMPEVELFHDNAITFEKYGEFNVFFLFNPFDPDIYKKVIDRICESISDSGEKRVLLICYGASIPEYIENTGVFKLTEEYTDSVRGTGVKIWIKK